ncbi:MAG: hypothetical protein II298_07365 [Bacteroidales bacterium]|nr:hypothetical protein [Bacteroidales bacterium]
MVEKFYILGKLGDSDGFQVYDLKSKTTAQSDDYSFLDTSFHKDGYKELFKISRKGYKTYYTYIKNNLSSDRTGCMLGFSYVYEDNGNVIKDFLGLRQKMKEALNHLLKGNDAIKITSFNDNSVNTSLKHIEDFTKKVNAEILALPSNPTQFPTQNPNDLTNEKIWEMLKKSVNVEITEEIPTALSQKEQTIKTLTSQIQKLGISIQQKDTEISKLKNEKDVLIKSNEDLTTQLKDANSKNGGRDREIKKHLKEIENKLSPSTEIIKIDDVPQPRPKIEIKSLLPFVLAILLVVDIIIGIVGLSNNSKEDNSTETATIEELEKSKDLEEKEFDVWPEDINQENNPSTEISTSTKPPSVQENKSTKEDAPAKTDKEKYEEWRKNQSNRDMFTDKLKEYAEKEGKKYEEINKDCRDCKSITDDEKFNLHKQWYPKCYEKK